MNAESTSLNRDLFLINIYLSMAGTKLRSFAIELSISDCSDILRIE